MSRKRATLPSHRIETRKVADLRPADYNPRKIDKKAQAGLTASIERFGAVQPIIVNDRTGNIVGGHQRLKSLIDLGQDETTVVVIDVDEVEEKALNVALNNPHIAGEFTDALGDILASVQGADEGLFTDLRLDELLSDAPAKPKDGETDPDDVPEAPANPVTRPGDLWVLGSHRLICGDCRSADDMQRLLGGSRVNLAFTSPPYASQREYDASSGFKPIPPDGYVDWFEAVQAHVRASLAADGSWFVNIKEHCEDGQRHLYVKDLAVAHVRRWGWRFVDELVWYKRGLPGDFGPRFRNDWEPIFHYVPERTVKVRHEAVRHHSWQIPTGSKGSNAKMQGSGSPITGKAEGLAYPGNVLEISTRKNPNGQKHSAAFPVDLPEFFVKAYTDPGDLVFDPFMGSGTTMIAAERNGRRCAGTEISPAYCDMIVTRWQAFTGKEATLDGDGRTFAEIKAERIGEAA